MKKLLAVSVLVSIALEKSMVTARNRLPWIAPSGALVRKMVGGIVSGTSCNVRTLDRPSLSPRSFFIDVTKGSRHQGEQA